MMFNRASDDFFSFLSVLFGLYMFAFTASVGLRWLEIGIRV